MTEAELCAEFITLVRKHGWKAHPECCGWDIVLEKDDTQIGVEAKLRANCKVLEQACPPYGTWPGRNIRGPHFRSVLVPKCDRSFSRLAVHLHLFVFNWKMILKRPSRFKNRLRLFELRDDWNTWRHKYRLKVPSVEFDIPAGTAAPIRVTPWKIAAVKLSLRIKERGHITSLDFKEFGISSSTPVWESLLYANGTVRLTKPGGKRPGNYAKLYPVEDAKLFDEEFPYITKVIDQL